MRTVRRIATATTGSALVFASIATAGDPVAWSFDVATEGEDVSWTSPTAVDSTAPRYDIAYELTLIEIRVRWLGIPFDFDVTEEVPPENRTGSAIFDGPPPIVIFEDRLVLPPPPEPPSFEGTLDMRIDADGFGRFSLTDVFLGQIEIEIPPFGIQTVDLERVRVAGDLTVTPLGPAADVNGDCTVDLRDLLAVLASWGACPEPPEACPADINGDGFVDFADLLEVLNGWGETYEGC